MFTQLFDWFSGARQKRTKSKGRPHRSVTLTVEQLEDRLMLSTFRYVGGGNSINWSAAANWIITVNTGNGNVAPGTGDTAIFDMTPAGNRAGGAARANVTVDGKQPIVIDELKITKDYTGTITLDNSLEVKSKYEQAGGTIVGDRFLRIEGGQGAILAPVTISAPVGVSAKATLTIQPGAGKEVTLGRLSGQTHLNPVYSSFAP